MAQNRFYSSVAAKTTLSGGINNSQTTITVAAVTGFPGSFPYTLILERDTASEEVITVTAAAGTTLTVVRGQDGTSAVSHSSGATVEHGVSARDFNEPQAHMAAASGVHGLAGTVVGTTDAQTLTNKTLTGPNIAVATLSSISSPTQGMVAFETTTGTLCVYNSGAWQVVYTSGQDGVASTYTPNWYDNAGNPPLFSSGTRLGYYTRRGNTVVGAAFVLTGTGTFNAGSVSFDLPVAPNGSITDQMCGGWWSPSLATGGHVRTLSSQNKGVLLAAGGTSFYAGNPGTSTYICANFSYVV